MARALLCYLMMNKQTCNAEAATAQAGQPLNATSWPRHLVKSVDTRKRDLVIRVTDWTTDKDEPAFDVETYVAGVYDWNESECFTTKSSNRSKAEARRLAVAFAQAQIEKFTGRKLALALGGGL